MRRVEEIAEQIRSLSDAELVEFRKWYAEFDAREWDQQIAADAKAGKPDPLADADRAWLDEIQRRSAEFDAGLVKVVPAEEVFERVRVRLKR